jgi:voltage-gated potassium channel
MPDREERPSRAQDLDSARQERVQRWLDRNIANRGLRPRYAAYLVVVTWLVAVVAFGILERLVDPETFPNVWLAWWWAIQTVTTVGYGDVVPHQTAGKVVGALLMLGGLSFLSVLTALITSSFVARRQQQVRGEGSEPLVQEMERLSTQLDALTAELVRARTGAPPDAPDADDAAGPHSGLPAEQRHGPSGP